MTALDPIRSVSASAPDIARNRRGPLRPGRLSPTRRRVRAQDLTRLYRFADAAMLALAAAAGLSLAHQGPFWARPMGEIAPFFAGPALAVVALSLAGAYRFSPRERLSGHLARTAAAMVVCAMALADFMLMAHPQAAVARGQIIGFGLGLAGLAALHLIWRWRVTRLRREGRLTPTLVIVGATPNARRLIARALESGDAAVLGVFDDRSEREGEQAAGDLMGVPLLGDTQALIGHRIMPYVDQVVIAVSGAARARIGDLVGRLSVLPNDITLMLEAGTPQAAEAAVSRILDAPLARLSGRRQRRGKAMVKRMLDLVVGGLALAFFAPVMLVVALAIKLDSPGPVFFRQSRQGFNNEDFSVWKFRSMHHEQRDERAERQTEACDPRVTRVGRFIRKTSLDELPQLFNVLAGEMSLVGPRPHSPHMRTGEAPSASLVAHYAHRHRLKPGMTGWAVIHGSLGPLHSQEAVRERVALDVAYIERQSLWLDLYILLMTPPRLIGGGHGAR